ncbi:hypothetical protein ACH4M0_10135 [Streptomyces albidoflavus]
MIIATVAQRKLVRVAALRKPRSATTTAAAARVPRTAPAFKAMENSSEELRS